MGITDVTLRTGDQVFKEPSKDMSSLRNLRTNLKNNWIQNS